MPTPPLRLAIIRERKDPPDSRVALTPTQAADLHARDEFDVAVEPSPGRCYADAEYLAAGLPLADDLSDRDVLIGVKEVPPEALLAGKTYLFFSHTHKQQPYNRGLLRAVLERRVRLIDYELLTTPSGARVIAFGRFAGLVGAHHGLRAYGLRTGAYDLPQLTEFDDYAAAREAYPHFNFGAVRVAVTGTGRVGQGAVETLRDAGLRECAPAEFRGGAGAGVACFAQFGPEDYTRRVAGGTFDREGYYADPSGYEADFADVLARADVLVHGIFWDDRAPAMFALSAIGEANFRVGVIADVTCDIAPVTSIPTTYRAATIAEPYFGVDRATKQEVPPFADGAVTMMTVDNLPNELPRDASNAFGTMFMEHVAPELLRERSNLIDGATIARDGRLESPFTYLTDFAYADD